MEQTIEIKKKKHQTAKVQKIHGKIQQKMTHKIIWKKKKHLVDFERERKETKIDNNNNKQTSCERVNKTNKTKSTLG